MATILVTDDDDACRDTIQKNLEREGFRVESAANVDAAIEAIHRRAFDLIICDYRMPGKNGLDLLAELQAFGPQIPVLMISAYVDVATQVYAELLGAKGMLKKPFRRQDLIESVTRAIPAAKISGQAPIALKNLSSNESNSTQLGELWDSLRMPEVDPAK